MSQTGIYKITNTVNGKLYVGSAVNFAARRRLHLHHLRHNKHHSAYLQRAFRKYGEEAFVFELIEEVSVDRNLLLERETHWIRTLLPQYNVSTVSATRLGSKNSEATQQKMREVATRPEVIAARRAALLGKSRPPEVIEKIRQALTGKKVSEKARQALALGSLNRTPEQRKGMLGKRHSETTLQRMRNAITEEMRLQRAETMKFVWAGRSDEERRRIAEAAHSEEATQKRAESMKAVWQDEAYHQGLSEKIRNAWQDETLRQEQSERMKIRMAAMSPEELQSHIAPTLTAEVAAKKAKASKEMWANRSDEERRRIHNATKSPEALRKRSETMKATLARKKAAQQGTA